MIVQEVGIGQPLQIMILFMIEVTISAEWSCSKRPKKHDKT
jgi:hypothetical protein